MRQQLSRPLVGKRILVTRPKASSAKISSRLRRLGAETIEFPLIRFDDPQDTQPLDDAIHNIGNFDIIVFTSPQGVRSFFRRMRKLGHTRERMGGMKIAAVGPGTTHALRDWGFKENFMPQRYLTDLIPGALGEIAGKRVLLPRSDLASDRLARALEQKGAEVTKVVAYRTLRDVREGTEVNDIINLVNGVDLVTLTSPSIARSFIAMIGKENFDQVRASLRVACIGPVTAEAARKLGFGVELVASTHTADGLVEAILGWASRNG